MLAGRRGADIAVGRGGGETNDVVGEEKREASGKVAAVKVQESPSESR